MTLQEAIKTAYEDMKAKGFHSPSPSIPAMLAMISSELGEALEADRKGKKWDQNINKHGTLKEIFERPKETFKSLYELYIKDTFEAELANACIRIFDLAGLLGLEIWISPLHLKEADLPGNIMEAMEQIGIFYNAWENYGSESGSLRYYLSSTLGIIFAIAKKIDIDLWSHIETAMRYNRLRELKHGKNY